LGVLASGTVVECSLGILDLFIKPLNAIKCSEGLFFVENFVKSDFTKFG
jgi:hypothetical protein